MTFGLGEHKCSPNTTKVRMQFGGVFVSLQESDDLFLLCLVAQLFGLKHENMMPDMSPEWGRIYKLGHVMRDRNSK